MLQFKLQEIKQINTNNWQKTLQQLKMNFINSKNKFQKLFSKWAYDSTIKEKLHVETLLTTERFNSPELSSMFPIFLAWFFFSWKNKWFMVSKSEMNKRINYFFIMAKIL